MMFSIQEIQEIILSVAAQFDFNDNEKDAIKNLIIQKMIETFKIRERIQREEFINKIRE